MSVENGRTSNNIDYAYKLTLNQFFGRYECRVHRSLLDNCGAIVDTEPFELDDSAWSVTIEHDREGHLGVYLFSEDPSCVTLHFACTLVNFKNADESRTQGCRKTLLAMEGEGWHNVASIASMIVPDSGFLSEDYFTVLIDMRIILQDNEMHALSTLEQSTICTWKLRHLRDMAPVVALTDTIEIGGTRWRLEVYPDGCARNSEGLCVYLVNRNEESIAVNFVLQAVNCLPDAKDAIKEFDKTICGNMSEGWDSFLSSQEMEDESLGFLQNGWLTLVATITVLDTESHRSNKVIVLKSTDSDVVSCAADNREGEACYCMDCIQRLTGWIADGNNIPHPSCVEETECLVMDIS